MLVPESNHDTSTQSTHAGLSVSISGNQIPDSAVRATASAGQSILHSLSSILESPQQQSSQITKDHTVSSQTTTPSVVHPRASIKRLKTKIENQIKKELTSAEKAAQNREQTIGDIQELNINALKGNIGDEDILLDFYKICGCLIAYSNFKPGDKIPAPGRNTGEYIVDEMLINDRGLHIEILVPSDKNKVPRDPPILCCKGTNPTNIHNIIDNVGVSGKKSGIGQYSYEISHRDIQLKLFKLAQEYGPCVVTGHSLGGALAQLITANLVDYEVNFSSVIKDTYHFNSPGVGSEVLRQHKKKLKKLHQSYIKTKNNIDPSKIKLPTVVSVRNADDLVYHMGGSHIHANRHYILYNTRIIKKISNIFKKIAHHIREFCRELKTFETTKIAHAIPGLVSSISGNAKIRADGFLEERFHLVKLLEILRQSLGHIFAYYKLSKLNIPKKIQQNNIILSKNPPSFTAKLYVPPI